ncbi:type II secretion system F family protein [Candidatus Ruminimicrobium bovinum]|uniref:type II secretion system F family protein n=1 Tax=Candidatus Ruminimicrobium bovinum TaxID=3242779 RepID=UPI0039B92421
MIYFPFIILCIFTVLFILIHYLIVSILNLNKNKNNYKAQQNNDKYFLFKFLLKTINPSAVFLRKRKIKHLDNYSQKIVLMTKILNIPYVYINGYNLIILQIISAMFAVFIIFILIGFDVVTLLCASILFFILPYLKIIQDYKKRINLILKQLPDFADLLSVMMSAGIDFNNALIKLATVIDGVLADEIQDINSKINFGLPVEKAFEEFAQKYNLTQIDMFVRTVNFSLKSGLGMAEALNKISNQLKTENAALAEKKAQEAPVKMLIPMTLLIFPTIFILLFAPIIISFLKTGI